MMKALDFKVDSDSEIFSNQSEAQNKTSTVTTWYKHSTCNFGARLASSILLVGLVVVNDDACKINGQRQK